MDRIKKYLTDEQIKKYYNVKKYSRIEGYVEIKVYYELQGNKYDEFKKKYGSCHEKPVIPKTWNMKYDNCNKTDGKIIFSGPIDNIIEVMNSINYFYQGFNYTIT